MVHLDLSLLPDLAGGTMVVSGTMRLRLTADSSLGPTLEIHPHPGLFAFEQLTPLIRASVRIVPDSTRAEVRFDHPVTRGAAIEIRFRCLARPDGDEMIITDRLLYADWTLGWHPYPLPPADAPWPALAQRAPGNTTVHLPPGWRSAASGTFAERTDTGREVVERWHADSPIPRTLAAARYEVVQDTIDGREVQAFYLPPARTRAARQARMLGEARATLEQWFGPLPYPGPVRLVEVPREAAGFVGKGGAGIVVVRSAILEERGWERGVLAHELAHAWWGTSVVLHGTGSLLLGEALAQYAGAIVTEARDGDSAGRAFLDAQAESYFRLLDRDKPMARLNGGEADALLAWSKGVWVFHIVRHAFGQDSLSAALTRIAHDVADGFVAMERWREIVGAAAPPGVDAEALLTLWLDRPGAPVLSLEWEPAGNAAAVRIRQEGEPFEVPIEVAVDSDRGSRLHTVVLRGAETRVVIIAAGHPSGVRLDPRGQLLFRPVALRGALERSGQ